MTKAKSDKPTAKLGDERTISQVCKACETEYEVNQFSFGNEWLPRTILCDPCQDKAWQEHEKKVAYLRSQELIEEFKRRCPAAMLETDQTRLPASQFAKVISWDMKRLKGLMLYGKTGSGKTRSIWCLLKQLTLIDGFTRWEYYSTASLGRMISETYGNDRTRSPVALFNHLCQVPLLVLDDMGKEKLTERVETDLFDIIRERTDQNRALFITTNFDGKRLAQRFNDPDLAEPLVRRLRENLEPIHYG